METRTIFFLLRGNPERFKVLAEVATITPETLQPPKTQIGISISALEIDQCQTIGIPTLRRCLVTDQAFASDKPEPGCQFIALMCLKDGVDWRQLGQCTLAEAFGLCLTWDGNGLEEPAPA